MGFSLLSANQNPASEIKFESFPHTRLKAFRGQNRSRATGETPVAHLGLRTIDCSSRTLYSSLKDSRSNGKVVCGGSLCSSIVCKTGGKQATTKYTIAIAVIA